MSSIAEIYMLKDHTHLTDVAITASFASKIESTNRAGDMFLSTKLVHEESHVILKVHVTSAAVLMLRVAFLVPLHLVDCPEEMRAVVKGTGHVPLGRHLCCGI